MLASDLIKASSLKRKLRHSELHVLQSAKIVEIM